MHNFFGFWRLAIGGWLLAVGGWLLAVSLPSFQTTK